jgi:ubiquinol-cytochrome c reductase cytochrome c subunit
MHAVVRRACATVIVVLALPAAAGAQPGVGVKAKTGKGLYAAYCLSCHGVGGSGVTSTSHPPGVLDVHGLGPPLRSVGALAADFYLTTGYMPLADPYEQPRHTKSPFDNREIAALVAYVASLGKGPGIPHPQPQRGDVSRGLSLFTEHCAGCHQVVAEGGYVTNAVAPPLHQATPVQIAEAVRIGPYLMPTFPASQISDAQLNSIIAYVQWAKNPDDRGGWSIGRIGPVPEGLVAWLIAATALVGCCLVIGRRFQR